MKKADSCELKSDLTPVLLGKVEPGRKFKDSNSGFLSSTAGVNVCLKPVFLLGGEHVMSSAA